MPGDGESPGADSAAQPKRARHEHQQPARHAQQNAEGDDLFRMQIDDEPQLPQEDYDDMLPGQADMQEPDQEPLLGADAAAEVEMPDEAELEDMADAEGLPIEQ